MNETATAPWVTTEELLAMPDDGVERWLIRGQLRESQREKTATFRNRLNTRIEARLAQLLLNWSDERPEPRGQVHSGAVGCRLRSDPDSTVRIDLVYVSAETSRHLTDEMPLINGPPTLAVAIPCPLDTVGEVNETIDECLASGVALVWIIDPFWHTVCVHRPGAEPELFNADQELTAEPHLPGFRAAVARIFAP